MRKICIITGTRAEWGLLSGLAKAIQDDPELCLQVIATNMHLAPEFGSTYREIESDGFRIDKKVDMLLYGSTADSTVKSCGVGMIGFADAYRDLAPDLLVILGDRYEMLAAAFAALLFRIPIAHLHGGEISEGACDDSIRHCITKLSSLHFASHGAAAARIVQLGELPDRVFCVGAIGVENIKKCGLMEKKELEKSLGFPLTGRTLLVTYHPATLESESPRELCGELLLALDRYPDCRVIFTQPNSDPGGRIITQCLEEYVAKRRDRCVLFSSLGKIRYLSALRYVTAVVGNSSSGIIEVPSFGIPTLDIGIRQQGRMAAPSVLHCGTDADSIAAGLAAVLSDEVRSAAARKENPYDLAGTTENILRVLRDTDLSNISQKKFYDCAPGSDVLSWKRS